MNHNKVINRSGQRATSIFDDRNLKHDYRHLHQILKPGMQVLDVGCGTGAISRDVAQIVGPQGQVIGIDNTAAFIESGRSTYGSLKNLRLDHIDLFDFRPGRKFDLIMAARVLQWLSNPLEAMLCMKEMLVSGGWISILDYNHEALRWDPAPPQSMQQFYDTFLRWREEAGMNNHMAEDLAPMMEEIGLEEIEIINSDEYYDRNHPDFEAKLGIWAKVAGSTQMVKEGYLDETLRIQAIRDYNEWVKKDAISMTMKLNEVRGRNIHIQIRKPSKGLRA